MLRDRYLLITKILMAKYKRLGAVLAYGFVYFCDGSCKWMVGV